MVIYVITGDNVAARGTAMNELCFYEEATAPHAVLLTTRYLTQGT